MSPLTSPRPTPSLLVVAYSEELDHPEEPDEELSKILPTETYEEFRARCWNEGGWAPWEEALTPEADFAKKSLDVGVEVPLTTPEAVEAFKMLRPAYRKKKIEEIGVEEYVKQIFAVQGEIPEKLTTLWAGPLAVRLMPPRDWPPKGWKVDKAELEFIREAHKLESVRVDVGGSSSGSGVEWMASSDPKGSFFQQLKEIKEILDAGFGQHEELWTKFKEWAKANPERLEKIDDARVLMGNDFPKRYKEWVKANRDEASKGEGIDEVENVVKRYEEFVKQCKEKATADTEKFKQEATDTVNEMTFERYKVFLKQYIEWVDANRDRLEEESYKVVINLVLLTWFEKQRLF